MRRAKRRQVVQRLFIETGGNYGSHWPSAVLARSTYIALRVCFAYGKAFFHLCGSSIPDLEHIPGNFQSNSPLNLIN